MIREILNPNICFKATYIYNKNTVECVLEDNDYLKGVGKSEEEASEMACRQYVKDNGFKLGWFDKETQHYYELADWDIKGLMALLCLHKYTDVKSLKLIAWLYANDIDIRVGGYMNKEKKIIKLIMGALYKSDKMFDRETRDLLIKIIYILESDK